MVGKRILVITCMITALGGLVTLPVSAARTKVTFWHSAAGKLREVTDELMKRFNESQSDYQVVGTYQGDYWESLAKFRVALVSRTAPALTQLETNILPRLHETGVVENLEPYATEKNPVNLNDFVPGLSQPGGYEYFGKEPPLFAMPFNRSTPIMYTNKDMLDKKGLAVPTTWDELRDTAEKLTVVDTKGETQVYGFETPVRWWFWYAKIYQQDGRILNEDGTEAAFEKEGIEALQYWVDMVNKYKCMKHPPGKDFNAWSVAANDFVNEKVGMIYHSTGALSSLTINSPFKIQCGFLPKKERYAVPTGGTFFVVWNGAKQKEKEGAWAFIKWMTELDQTIYYAQNTGYMPVRISAINSSKMAEWYQKYPNYKVSVDQLQYAVTWPFFSGLYDTRELVQANIDAPVLGLKSVKETVEMMVREVNKMVAK